MGAKLPTPQRAQKPQPIPRPINPVDRRPAFLWMLRVGRGFSWPTNRREVTRLKVFLKWVRRFWFRMKFEFEAGFNTDRDR